MRTALARALSIDDVNRLSRETGQGKRLRAITPHRLFCSTLTGLPEEGRVPRGSIARVHRSRFAMAQDHWRAA
jgi:hypothetical protein